MPLRQNREVQQEAVLPVQEAPPFRGDGTDAEGVEGRVEARPFESARTGRNTGSHAA